MLSRHTRIRFWWMARDSNSERPKAERVYNPPRRTICACHPQQNSWVLSFSKRTERSAAHTHREKMEESEGIEPPHAGITDTHWFSRPAHFRSVNSPCKPGWGGCDAHLLAVRRELPPQNHLERGVAVEATKLPGLQPGSSSTLPSGANFCPDSGQNI